MQIVCFIEGFGDNHVSLTANHFKDITLAGSVT